jgi:hypothetical protein
MPKVEITITMEENGGLVVSGNIAGAHLIGVIEMAKASVMKTLIGEPLKADKPAQEKPAEIKTPGNGPEAEERLMNQSE